jgi:hypothetical protein
MRAEVGEGSCCIWVASALFFVSGSASEDLRAYEDLCAYQAWLWRHIGWHACVRTLRGVFVLLACILSMPFCLCFLSACVYHQRCNHLPDSCLSVSASKVCQCCHRAYLSPHCICLVGSEAYLSSALHSTSCGEKHAWGHTICM